MIKVNTIERSSNATLPFSIPGHIFVHTETEHIQKLIAAQLRAKEKCFLCTKLVATDDAAKEQHAWDHLVIRVCKCGLLFNDFKLALDHC